MVDALLAIPSELLTPLIGSSFEARITSIVTFHGFYLHTLMTPMVPRFCLLQLLGWHLRLARKTVYFLMPVTILTSPTSQIQHQQLYFWAISGEIFRRMSGTAMSSAVKRVKNRLER